MVWIQINLTQNEDRIINIYKATHELKTKEQAIKQIIQKAKP